MMMMFQSAEYATFAAFGLDAVYTPAGGEPGTRLSNPTSRKRRGVLLRSKLCVRRCRQVLRDCGTRASGSAA
jgi:hypothetical protein